MEARKVQRQRGQSIVIVAVAMIVLLIFGAFAVDLSFAYFQRRSMQNAADAAALAGARALGVYQSDPSAPAMTTGELYQIIADYAARNKAKYVEAYYTAGGMRAGPITPGSGSQVPKSGVSGVEVIASTDFATFFARVMGYSLLPAEASAAAAYGAAVAAKYVAPIAIHESDVEVGQSATLWDKNLATGNADTGWLALTCRYPSHGSYCTPSNPDLRDWTLSGYPGVTRAPAQISGTPAHDFWHNVRSLSPGDVLILPVFDKVYHYTTYSKCHPDYVARYGAYECWAHEEYGEVIPIYTTNSAYEPFYFYNVITFAAFEVHAVQAESLTGKFISYSVEGDWVNSINDGVLVVKLTDNKGVPTSTSPTRTPTSVPACDASLALSFTPEDNYGLGPYVFTLSVENTGSWGSAQDVIVEISVIRGQEWVQALSPEVWNLGELPAGQIATQEVILTPNEDWQYPPPRGPEIGAEIKLEARIVNEGCRPEHNEGRRDTGTAIKNAHREPPPTSTAEPTDTPAPTATPTRLPGGHLIEFISSSYDGTNTTFTYRVTSGRKPSISNWVLTGCFDEDDLVNASEIFEYVHPDPHSGLTGVKFDRGYEDNEVRIVRVTLRGEYSESMQQYSIKAGQNIVFGTVTGPGCAPTHTPTSTRVWVQNWTGSLGNDEAICIYEPQWIVITGTVSLTPPGSTAYLQTAWRVVHPSNPVCPPEVPNCTQTQYQEQMIMGDTTFTIRAWWPGIRPGDQVVEIHYGANVLDRNHNPIHDGIGLDLYWYPWYCPPPTATPTPTPTATPSNHLIEFVSSHYDGTNTTFTYRVTSGGQPAISNWVLTGGFDESEIVGASEAYEYVVPDADLHLIGIKFTQGYQVGESRTVSFTLRGEFPESVQQFGIKAGGGTVFGSITGPGSEVLPTATPCVWATGWTGSLGEDQPVCLYEPQWTTITGTVSLIPSGSAAFLETFWYVVSPSDAVCPPEVPDCTIPQWEKQLIVGDTTFSITGWWPGIRPNDQEVKVHFGANVLDEEHKPIGGSIGMDIYWNPSICQPPAPTSTPTSGPATVTPTRTSTATVTPTPGGHRIDFLSSSYDGMNTTFTYRVTSGSKPAISNWILTGCFTQADLVGASEPYEYVTNDPNLGLTGVKFGRGYADNEVRTVTVTFRGAFTEAMQQYGIKASSKKFYGTVIGPGCGAPPTPTETATPTITPTPTPFAIRINAGASSDWMDPSGNLWLADRSFYGSSSGWDPGTTDDIRGTQWDYMFQRYRTGDFWYQFFRIPNGTYVVRLWFCEPWYTANNKRQFKVFINGTKVLSNLDIHARVGHDYKLVYEFTVPVTNNQLKIRFQPITDSAIVSGIVVLGK